MEIFKIYIVIILFVITILLMLLLGGIAALQEQIKKQSKPESGSELDLLFKIMHMTNSLKEEDDE